MDFLLNIWYQYPIPVIIVLIVGCGVCVWHNWGK